MAHRHRKKLVVGVGLLVLVLGAFVGLDAAASNTAKRLNGVHRSGSAPYEATKRGAQVHQRLLIADLHADPLLWNRDLTRRSTEGHVDVPRLLEGNVALQVFAVVTKTPKNMNPDRNDDATDQIRLLAVAQRWPPATWTSLKERALHQAVKLERLEAGSDGALLRVLDQGDLQRLLDARARQGPGKVVGAVLALEGMHALEGDASSVDALYDAGFRMLAPAHFFDNDAAGSAHGVTKGGLTKLGREVVARMEAKGMTVDLAHASAATLRDVLAVATKPVVVSHTGVKGTCDNSRNLTDAQLRAVAQNGGVVGIGYWSTATCGKDAKAIVRALRHAVRVAGIDHVGLGSDFDGAVTTPFDAAGLVELTDALLAAGFTEAQLQKLMGGNVLRVLRHNLPE